MFAECSFCWQCEKWQSGVLFNPRFRAKPSTENEIYLPYSLWSWRCRECDKVKIIHFFNRKRRNMIKKEK
jgi:hypothetical protein